MTTALWIRLGLALMGTGALVAIAWAAVIAPDSPARRLWLRYSNWVDASLRPLFLRWTPQRYAARHAGAVCIAALSLYWLMSSVFLAGLAATIVTALGFRWPTQAQARRIDRLDAQIDSTLRNIAQTLKATPNIVDALETVAVQIEPPMRDEIALVLKQHRVGLTIEDALSELTTRVASRNLDAAVTAIVIGRLTGGNLPAILEEIAAVLRERMRLDAFIDAKTAEGKMQAWFMGLLPVIMSVVIYALDPEFMRPMFVDPIGWVIVGIVALMIVAGVVLVRKVSAVDA